MNSTKKIDNLIAGLEDWRGPMFTKIRQLIHEVNPDIKEEWKYMGTPCWYYDGSMIAVGDAFKTSIKLGFLYGASLSDPNKLFNDELGGNQRRAIKFYEGDSINEKALKALIQTAIDFNQAKKKTK